MKQTYQIEITQTLQRIVELESDSLETAVTEIHKQLKNEVIVLNENDYIGTDIKEHQVD